MGKQTEGNKVDISDVSNLSSQEFNKVFTIKRTTHLLALESYVLKQISLLIFYGWGER